MKPSFILVVLDFNLMKKKKHFYTTHLLTYTNFDFFMAKYWDGGDAIKKIDYC